MRQRLYRSTHDRRLAGVCGGLAETWDLDPSLVRIAWVILTILTGGVLFVVYVAMAIIVPEGPPGWAAPWPNDRYAATPSWSDWNRPQASPGSASQSPGGPAWSAPSGAPAGAPAGDSWGTRPESTGSQPPFVSADPGASPPDVAPQPADGAPAAAGAPTPPYEPPAGTPPPVYRPYVPPSPPFGPPPHEAWRARWDTERPRRHGLGGIVFGLILVLIGGAFLLRQAVPSIDFDVLWPAVVICLGVVLLVAAFIPRGDGQREG
jgi:phage shock protein C